MRAFQMMEINVPQEKNALNNQKLVKLKLRGKRG